MYDSYKTAVGRQTRDVKTVPRGRNLALAHAVQGASKIIFPLPVPSLAALFALLTRNLALACAVQHVQGRFKNYFPITGTFFSCSFDKEFGSRTCSSGALQKLFSHYWCLI
jgi:hypothetical protein